MKYYYGRYYRATGNPPLSERIIVFVKHYCNTYISRVCLRANIDINQKILTGYALVLIS
jgi:hypothetical protein